jgi:dephospho-CoA kinase
MYKLGITGGMGSGKSTAADFFLQKGAIVFDADEEAKKYLLSHLELQNRIIDTFGAPVIRENRLDLLRLSEHVFSSKDRQSSLNNIIWSEVYTLIVSASEKAELDSSALFVVDAALLLEADYTDFFNSILLITAKKSIRVKRIQLRKNIPEDQIEKRMALQMSESEKQKRTHSIIENNGNLQKLHLQLELFWKKLNIN